MKVTTKKISDTKVELKVSLDQKDWEEARKKAVERLAKELKIAGFRKGKAPAELAEKNLAPNEVTEATVDIAVRTTVPVAFKEAKQNPIVVSNVDVTKIVSGEMIEYTATAEILPEIELGDFKGLKTKKPEVKVSKKEIDEVLENVAKAYAETKVVQREAKDGDEVIIDFTGKKDGKEFAGGKAKDYKLVLGSKQFIPGFEEGVVGHKTGDKFEIELTFPKDYHAEDLAGKDVVFEILLKQVNEVIKAKLDDELAKKCGPFKNIGELRADIEKNLKSQNEYKLGEQYKDDLVKELVKASKVKAPEILIEDQVRIIKTDVERNAQSQGLDFETFLKQVKSTEEEWLKEAKKVAESRVKASLVLQKLAEEQKISVSEKEVTQKIDELKMAYKNAPEAIKSLKNPRVKQDIANRLVIEKTLEFLVDENKK